MPSSAGAASRLLSVPLFPLPNVVLLPRAVLPLHIFEPRYRMMIADALTGDRLIAMALLRGNWCEDYHGSPPIHDVVCVGEIIAHERLADGRYNLLLEGKHRARIVEEDRTLAYRRADLERLPETHAFDIDVSAERDTLSQLLRAAPLVKTTLGRELSHMLAGPMSTADAADLCAFHLIDDIAAKQRLLEQTDAIGRVREIVRILRATLAPAGELTNAAKWN